MGFQSGAAIRSTPLVKGNMIYAGNAAGDFIAIDKRSRREVWKYHTGSPIHSSAIAAAGKLFFSDNRQALYALNKASGKLLWKFNMGLKQDYPWRFDYYYALPIISEGKLYVGGDDGFFMQSIRKVVNNCGSIKRKASSAVLRLQ